MPKQLSVCREACSAHAAELLPARQTMSISLLSAGTVPGGAFFGGADSLASLNSGVEKYPLLGQSALVGSQRLIALRSCLLGYCMGMFCLGRECVILFLGKIPANMALHMWSFYLIFFGT